MTLYLIAYVGFLAHWGFVLNSALLKPDFEWKVLFRKNIFDFIIQMIIIAIIIYAKEDIREDFGLKIGKLAAFFVGYLSGDIFHRITKVIKNKIDNIG